MERAEFRCSGRSQWTGVDSGALEDGLPPAPSSMEAFLRQDGSPLSTRAPAGPQQRPPARYQRLLPSRGGQTGDQAKAGLPVHGGPALTLALVAHQYEG